MLLMDYLGIQEFSLRQSFTKSLDDIYLFGREETPA